MVRDGEARRKVRRLSKLNLEISDRNVTGIQHAPLPFGWADSNALRFGVGPTVCVERLSPPTRSEEACWIPVQISVRYLQISA